MRTAEPITDQIRRRLGEGQHLDERIDAGRLYVDRPLPFLCLYRRPPEHRDLLTERLLTTQASYLIGSGEPEVFEKVARLTRTLAEAGKERFGRFLILEIWASPERGEADEDEPYSLQAEFEIAFSDAAEARPPNRSAARQTAEALADALCEIHIHHYASRATLNPDAPPAPPGCEPILPRPVAGRRLPPDSGAVILGLEIAPIYRDEATGAVYPFVFDALRRGLATAIKKTAFAFAERHTTFAAPHFLALGRRSLEQAVAKVDEGLARIGESFEFLLQITPVNAEEAWMDFEESGFGKDPVFRYRPLPVDPELLKRRLFDLPIEEVDDPSLSWIFREKQEELDRKITMLRDRDTRQFFFGSMQLYGEVRSDLLQQAVAILDRLPRADEDVVSPENLEAEAFAEVAAGELRHYRQACDEFPETVQIRRDMPPGLMVASGHLLIGHQTKVPASRIEALLHHEIGTHMLTYYNGRVQPLRILYNGLAGYESLQEGIAVLTEYLAGGLTIPRLRVLAARVVAAQSLIDGASFTELFGLLRATYEFERHEAFSIALRTFRGGGMIKDVIYLRGLYELIRYLQDGGDFEALLAGKLSLHHLPVLHELRYREILRPGPLQPRYLLDEQALDRLDRVRAGLRLEDMIDGNDG